MKVHYLKGLLDCPKGFKLREETLQRHILSLSLRDKVGSVLYVLILPVLSLYLLFHIAEFLKNYVISSSIYRYKYR